MIKIYIEEAEDLLRESPTYKEILEHRKECPKWGKDFCLGCFGCGRINFRSHQETPKELRNILHEVLK